MAVNKFLVAVLLLSCVGSGSFKSLPDYIKVCKWDPDTISSCAKHSVEKLRPKLAGGISEIDVQGIDPFFIPEIVPSSSSPLRAIGKNIVVTGAGNFSIKSLNVDLENFIIKARVRFPKLHFDGQYKVDTQLSALNLNGEGTLSADAIKCDADIVLYGKISEKDGAEYIHFNKLDMDINIKDYRIHLDGLFNGDKALGEAANQLINQNRAEFFRSSKPYVEKTVSKLLLELSNKVVKDLTVEQLLPKP